ncbi:unnamed protein product [Choristocarpus tenellus]
MIMSAGKWSMGNPRAIFALLCSAGLCQSLIVPRLAVQRQFHNYPFTKGVLDRWSTKLLTAPSEPVDSMEVRDEGESDITKDGERAGDDPVEVAKYRERMDAAPTLFKRTPEPSPICLEYKGAFDLPPASVRELYTGFARKSRKKGSSVGDGKKTDGSDILMRVVVVGANEREANFLNALQKHAAGLLVSGLYVIWDRRASELHESLENVENLNIHEFSLKDISNPARLAGHAKFLFAQMLVLLTEDEESEDYVSETKRCAEEAGVVFVGADVAKHVCDGDMTSFTRLVEEKRVAMVKEM